MTSTRQPTAIDRVAEDWVVTLADLDPDVAVWIGIPGRHGEYADLSPDGNDAQIAAVKKVITALEAAEVADSVDQVTKTDMLADLRLSVEEYDAGLWKRNVNMLASPAQSIRGIFDLMPHATEGDWETLSSRLRNLPGAAHGYVETLRRGIRDGQTPARRQVHEVLGQLRRHAAADGFFGTFTAEATLDSGQPLPVALQADLAKGAAASAAAYAELADFFATELESAATDQDAVGREIYALESRRFLGAVIDLDETYDWGVGELERMVTEQTAIAHEIKPGASVKEAIAHLEADQSQRLHGTKALQEWMQRLADTAVADLSKSHFDIPEPVRRIECMIAPTKDGGIYYSGPSDDFSRAGRMWWSVPEGVTEFDTWRETTTVYHEGVPGHHLQIGQAVYNRALLNTWRRQLGGTSGHAEGWALYAERLMEDLGYLDNPADRLGMLDGQRMRAARVVLDIGVHLGKQRLDGNGVWDYDYAFGFMNDNVNIGWPGQAPSYKVGQRIWEQLRDEVRRREGDAFSLKEFHRRALDIGGVGLDTLRAALLD